MLATATTRLIVGAACAQEPTAAPTRSHPNILVIFGDDIGQFNISAYAFGVVGYKTPNIESIAREGIMFTDHKATTLELNGFLDESDACSVPP